MAELAARHPEMQWRWLDIEDEADLMDSFGIDVETFPTVLLCREDQALFMGAIPPQAEALLFLMARLGAAGAVPAGIGGPAAVLAAHLWGRQDGPALSAV
jgi:hypothetical protein